MQLGFCRGEPIEQPSAQQVATYNAMNARMFLGPRSADTATAVTPVRAGLGLTPLELTADEILTWVFHAEPLIGATLE